MLTVVEPCGCLSVVDACPGERVLCSRCRLEKLIQQQRDEIDSWSWSVWMMRRTAHLESLIKLKDFPNYVRPIRYLIDRIESHMRWDKSTQWYRHNVCRDDVLCRAFGIHVSKSKRYMCRTYNVDKSNLYLIFSRSPLSSSPIPPLPSCPITVMQTSMSPSG